MWRCYLLAISTLEGSLFLPLRVPWLCTFCWGIRKVKESRLLLSWCPGGELGAGVGAAVGLLGAGVVGYVFAMDMVSVTCEL